MRPTLFDVFINDIFYLVNHSTFYNYADDNTLSFSSPDYDHLISILESESQVLIDWFKENKMQANPDKLQVIAVTKRTLSLQKIHLYKFSKIFYHVKKP